MIVSGRRKTPTDSGCDPREYDKKEGKNMGCLCNIFENETLWLIILTLLVLTLLCNGGACGNYQGGGCGCH